MIECKTAVLLAAALQIGAITANASQKEQNDLYEFGKNMGIAFQLKDDLLDAFGNPEAFGKLVGGDILSNKKTYLYLKSLEVADKNQIIKSLDETSVQASRFYIMVLGYLQDVAQSISYISRASYKHVNNNHKNLKKGQLKDLKNIVLRHDVTP